MNSDRLDAAYWALRVGLGGTAFVAGLDKFTNLLVNWEKYLSPVAREKSPIKARNFMRLVGVIEMLVGLGILRGNTRVGGYVAGAWLLGIAANLVAGQDWYDIAVRDVNMAIGALTLARLSEAREAAGARHDELFEELRRAA